MEWRGDFGAWDLFHLAGGQTVIDHIFGTILLPFADVIAFGWRSCDCRVVRGFPPTLFIGFIVAAVTSSRRHSQNMKPMEKCSLKDECLTS